MKRGQESYLSIDGEFTGLIPGVNSMISMGAVIYDSNGNEIGSFLKNLEELPESKRDKKTMNWWKKNPLAYQATLENRLPPKQIMNDFRDWLENFKYLGTPKIVAWPLGVDFMYFYWYWVNFLGSMPTFGFDGIDVKSFAMAKFDIPKLNQVSQTLKKVGLWGNMDDIKHIPVDDSRKQGDLFFRIKKYKN